jgi:wyosine [tRNA(Phe)-imidazoG37] synthetase (radical SAM superfamily)
MKYKHIFGPIISRRLGISLGIDLTPGRTCTLNCLYCECGKTAELTTLRREYVPTAEVISELRDFLNGNPRLDSITFSGSGEPTLHSGIGAIIDMLKAEFPARRVTVLTNSTLLSEPDVRADLLKADLVIPSLDAVSEKAFRAINRPDASLRSAGVIEGLVTFTHEYKGEIWLEVFIIPGVNDCEEELALLRDVFTRLRVTRIQLNTLDRPGAAQWIHPIPRQNLEEIARRLGDTVEVISRPLSRARCTSYTDDIEQRVLAILRVRPSTLEDLAGALGISTLETGTYLDVLLHGGRVKTQREERGTFYLVV